MGLSTVEGKWAVILGASSGFGEAIALKLSQIGVNIVGVHLDRKSTLPHVEEIVGNIQSNGAQAKFFNVNAADKGKRLEVVEEIKKLTHSVHCLVHSLAFGTLKPFTVEGGGKGQITPEQMDMTCNVMAHSLVYWTQDLFNQGLLSKGGHIFAMTSSGGTRVWPNYGPVSAAKAALESHCRQLALELAKHNITVNAVRAGVTDTPALRKIPGNEKMIEIANSRNPSGRLTTPEDVANSIALLIHPEANWITGNVLGVDGGEDIIG